MFSYALLVIAVLGAIALAVAFVLEVIIGV